MDGATMTMVGAPQKRKADDCEMAEAPAAKQSKGADQVRPLYPARPRHAPRSVPALGRRGGRRGRGDGLICTLAARTRHAHARAPRTAERAHPPLVHT